ncbi:hypothetical protein HC766_00515 [Candidatus Gracilibacteria bacterium]|nr:hypothetical protein [Candidatus Gracilibacteria bacterium]
MKYSKNLLNNEVRLGEVVVDIDSQYISHNNRQLGLIKNNNKSNGLADKILSLNCGACTYRGKYPIQKLLYLTEKCKADIFCFQDIEFDDDLFEYFELQGFNFIFIPTLKYDNEFSGMLTLTKPNIDKVSLYFDELSFSNKTENKHRSALYIQLGVLVSNITIYNCYRNSFTSYKQRKDSIGKFFQEVIKDKIVFIGDFNCYGKYIDSREKKYPFWYELSFLPQIVWTIITRVNSFNIYELKVMKRISSSYGLILFSSSKHWTYIKKIPIPLFQIYVGWVVDLVIANMSLQIKIVDGIIDDDHKMLAIRLK